MPRLYCPKEFIAGRQIVIHERKQIHYLYDVLRLEVNEDVFVFDGHGNEYHCQIQELSKKVVKLLIKDEMKIRPQSKSKLVVACALPKQKNRFDDLVDKLSQLGVDKIIPMITERVIVRWDSIQKQRHHQRWCKIAKQACIQSGRNILPVIEPIREIGQILTNCESYDLKLIPTLIERRHSSSLSRVYNNSKLRRIVHRSPTKDLPVEGEGGHPPSPFYKQNDGRASKDSPPKPTVTLPVEGKGGQNLRDIISSSLPKSILVLIGPEGDFTSQELTQAKKAEFIPVFLGEQILRVDTAALAVAAFVRLYEKTYF